MSFLNRFKKLSPAFEVELAALCAKHGMTFKPNNGRAIGGGFSEVKATLKFDVLDATAKNDDGTVKNQYEIDYKKYAGVYGFDLSWLGREFLHGGIMYRLTGFNMKKRDKFVRLTRVKDGQEGFMAKPEQVIPSLELFFSTNKKSA